MSHEKYLSFQRGKSNVHQDYLPQCAKKGRKVKSFLVEMPQGDNDFNRSKKKQYSALHNQSQIKDTAVMMIQKNPHFQHNNLSVKDIDGAVPNINNSMSQALKNRLKGLINKVSNRKNKIAHNRSYFDSDINQKIQNYNKGTLEPIQSQQKYNHKCINNRNETNYLNSQINYHYLRNKQKLNTEPKSTVPQKTESTQNIIPSRQRKLNTISHQQDQSYQQINKIKNTIDHQIPYINYQTRQCQQIKPTKIDRDRRRNVSLQQIYHGDTKKIRFIPTNTIRKCNPTYLSALRPIDHFPSSAYSYYNPESPTLNKNDKI